MESDFRQFICVGAARSGTTRLWEWMNEHPDVHMTRIKETNYFARDLIGRKGTGDRETLVDIAAKNVVTSGKRGAAIVQDKQTYTRLLTNLDKILHGEISPSYLFYAKQVAPRIREFNPECRIIILLREPVSRAISAHSYFTSLGRETLGFPDALLQEEERMDAGWEYAWSYRTYGFYYNFVNTFFEQFDRSNIWVGLYEDMTRSPQNTFDNICDFLEIGRAANQSTIKVNQSPDPDGALLRFSRTRAGNLAARLIPDFVKEKIRKLDDKLAQLTDEKMKNYQTKIEMRKSYSEDVLKLDKLVPNLRIGRKWGYS